MSYRVELSERAFRDLDYIYVATNAAESKAAARWYSGLEDAIATLAHFPYRCPVTADGRRLKRNLRHLLYGSGRHVYRIIYEIDEQRKAALVVHIRHGARRAIKPSDLT